MRRIMPLNADGQPMLDLIILGMGEDGHVASLFPGEAEATRADAAVYRAVKNSPKPPPRRVTLGYAAIAAARQVWVLFRAPARKRRCANHCCQWRHAPGTGGPFAFASENFQRSR